LQHLYGFTLHLRLITPSKKYYQERMLMKLLWYEIYAVVIRLLKLADRRMWEIQPDSSLLLSLNMLGRLTDMWWDIEVSAANLPDWLHERYYLSELKLSVYELQQALDSWHSSSGKAKGLSCAAIEAKFTRTKFLLGKHVHDSAMAIQSFRYRKVIQDATIACNTMVLEYVIFVTITGRLCNNMIMDYAIDAAHASYRIFLREAVGPIEERDGRIMRYLFLASLLLRVVEDYPGRSFSHREY